MKRNNSATTCAYIRKTLYTWWWISSSKMPCSKKYYIKLKFNWILAHQNHKKKNIVDKTYMAKVSFFFCIRH